MPIIEVKITTNKERFELCPAWQKARRMGIAGLPFEDLAGIAIRIYSEPQPQSFGKFAELCDATHWLVVLESAEPFGHVVEPWVCAHSLDID